MTYAQLLNAIATTLEPLVEAAGGKLELANSLEDAQAFLANAPGRWRVILHWEGYGDHPASRQGMTTHQVATAIQLGKGLLHRPGEHISNPLPSGKEPFSTRIAQVSGWMLALRFPNGTGADSAGFALGSSQWITTESNTTAHVLSWQLPAALPAFPQTIPLVFPHLNS